MITINSSVKLGTCTSLLTGYDPAWVPGDPEHTGLFPVCTPPLQLQDVEVNATAASWGYPQISIHDTDESLLSALFPYRVVNPNDGVKEAEISAGHLLIGDKDSETAMAHLSETLGVRLGQPGTGYVLVQLRNEVGSAVHATNQNGITIFPHPLNPDPKLGVNRKFHQDLVKVRQALGNGGHFDPEQLTAAQAQACLDLFHTHGTHFVSKATVGEVIFQVFACPAARFTRVKDAFSRNDFSGENAVNFVSFTSDVNTGQYGFVRDFGHVLCMSGDTTLEKALAAGEWRDVHWSGGHDSVFAPWLENGAMDSDTLASKYTAVAPVSFELTGLTLLAEFERRRTLKRVFKGAMIQKFKSAVTPHFESYCPFDMNRLVFQDDIPGFISTIATRNINTYKPSLDLGDLQFATTGTTESFRLCANSLVSRSPALTIPGSDVAILTQMAVFETDATVDTLVLSDTALATYQFACGRFYGCLQVINSSATAHETILDGLKYVYGDADQYGRYTVRVTTDVRTAPSLPLLAQMKDNLAFAFAFADSILAGNPAASSGGLLGVREFVTDALRWLGKVIPGKGGDPDLLDLRVRALDAARSAASPDDGAFVPLLLPDAYQKQVGNILNYVDAITLQMNQYKEQIDLRKEEELIHTVGQAINDNIIQSAQLLSKFVQANADQQSAMGGYYDAVLAQKQSELTQTQSGVDTLQSSLNAQKLEVGRVVDRYKTAVAIWQTFQQIKFGFEVAETVFELGAVIVAPEAAGAEVMSLLKMVENIQKLMKIMNSAFTIYTTSRKDDKALESANDALDQMDSANFDITSSLAWEELRTHMAAMMAVGPDVPEKNLVVEAFSVLVLRGEALLNAQKAANQLARDIYNQQRLQAIAQDQQNQLDALKNALAPANLPNLDPATLDLVGMTGSLMFIRSQMLGILAKTFELQDQSLQYQYLQPATPITSFSLLNFKGAIVKQGQNTLAAKTRLNAIQPSTTQPIVITLDVPVAQLTCGASYPLSIGLDNANFTEYVDARIQAVVAKVDGVAGTDAGKYLLKLEYSGTPFMDRNPDGNPVTFHTVARERTYEYDIATNQANFTDGGQTWSQDVNPVTPFSTWRISLPPEVTNRNLKFDGPTVRISLSFVLVARIAALPARARAMMLTAGVHQAPSYQDLVASMAGRSAVNGWDVVFNMTLAKIQAALNQQYDALKQNTSYGGKISASSHYSATSHITIFEKFDLQYGYPQLTFQSNDTTNVLLHIPVLSGSTQSGSQTDSNPIQWDAPVNVDPSAYISAIVPIGKVAGLVSTGTGDASKVLSVVLNLAHGTFVANNLEVENDADKAAFNTALVDYFTSNAVQFIISTLDLNQITTLEDMRPSEFLFKTLLTKTYQNQILQLFIMTGRRKALDYSQAFINNLDEPIPLGADCSLILSSKLFFNYVLPGSLSLQGWRLGGIDPGDSAKMWSAQFDQGMVSAAVDLSAMTTSGGGEGVEYTTSYDVPGGTVSLGVAGMTLAPGKKNVNLSFAKQETQQFIQHSRTCYYNCTSKPDVTLSSDYTINISADIPLAVSGIGREQHVSFSINDKEISVTGHLSGGGSCNCDDVQAQFNTQLNNQLPAQITKQVNVSFSDVSVFALKNLLFPSNNYIKLSEISVPGDVLLTGGFTV